jgi:kynureninase
MDRAACLALDDSDPLRSWRERFVIPRDVIYLDGNSLGALPVGVAERMERTIHHEWGTQLIRAWNESDWVSLPRRVGDRVARLIGAAPGTVVVCESTSVNLFKATMAAAALRSDRKYILTDSGNFPTDIYVMRGVAAHHDLELVVVDPEAVAAEITPDVAVVALTEVDYRTGRRHDMRTLTDRAHEDGALIVWDLAHSAGAFPIEVDACGVDLAVGCGYKYLNGGPGAPAFVYVAPHLHDDMANPITGWFGHVRPFDFSLEFDPAPGIERLRVGTPHILSLAALDEALNVFEDVDMEQVRRKSELLTQLFIDLVVERLGEHFEVITPSQVTSRGSQVSLRNRSAYPIVQALIERGVIGDFRAPDIARFGFAPLYTRFVDVWDAVAGIAAVMRSGDWTQDRFNLPRRVT